MNDLNKNLLTCIDSINDIVLESEMSVVCSMMDEYTKIGMLMEYADESVVEQFSIIQEAGIILEADEKVAEQNQQPVAEPKKENIFVRAGRAIVNGIKRLFGWIVKGVTWLFEKIGKLFSAPFESTKKIEEDTKKIVSATEALRKVTRGGQRFEDLTDEELHTILEATDHFSDKEKESEAYKSLVNNIKTVLSFRQKQADKEKLKEMRDNFEYEVVDKETDVSDEDVNAILSSLTNVYQALNQESPEMSEKQYDKNKLKELWTKFIVNSQDNKVKAAVSNIKKQNKTLNLSFDNAFKAGHFTPLGFLNQFIDDIAWIGGNLHSIDEQYESRINQASSYPCIYTELSSAQNNERIKQEIENQLKKLKSISITDAKTKVDNKPEMLQNVSNMINTKLLPYVSKQTSEMFAYNVAIMNIYKSLG